MAHHDIQPRADHATDLSDDPSSPKLDKAETAYVEQVDPNDGHLHPDHPQNFSPWRKRGIMVALAWSGFLANYGASSHLTAFGKMSKTFNQPIPTIANTIGYGLLGLAVGPVLWNPFSKTIGRRNTYLLGSLLYLPCIVWCAVSTSYSSFVAARIFAGLASGFSQTIPPATIADIYPKEVRGSKLSTYGLAVIIAPAISPLICSLVVNEHDWPIVYWIVLAFGGLQFLLFFFLVPETLWNESEETVDGQMRVQDVSESGVPVQHGKRGPAWMPWQRPKEFASMLFMPIAMLRFMAITIPSFYYGTLFAWSVGITIIAPQLYEAPPYGFKPIPTGCTYLGLGVGAILGKWSGGIVGDVVVTRITRRRGGVRQPEYRLYALLPILPFMIIGLLIFGITFQNKTHWIAPLIGGAVFYYCIAASTGILQTYVLETYLTRAMDTQAIFVFFKCIWGFAVSYFAIQFEEETSLITEYAVEGALATGMGALICGIFIWKGEAIRRAQGMPTINPTAAKRIA